MNGNDITHVLCSEKHLLLQPCLHVLMIGPALSARGGVSSVQNAIIGYDRVGRFDLTHVSTIDDAPIIANLAHFAGSLVRILHILIRKRPDLAHVHFASRGSTIRKIIVVLALKRLNVPVLLHAHGAEFEIFYSQLPKAVRILVRRAILKADGLIVLSSRWSDFFEHSVLIPRSKIHIMNNPVAPPPDEVKKRKGSIINFLLLGRLGKRKGVYDLIKAISRLLPTERETLHFTLAGDGELEEVEKTIHEYSLEKSFSVIPWVGPTERDELLQQADVYVLPSYNEGLPMSLLEALAWGCPVIATPVGGIPEVIVDGDNGLLVQPGDVEALEQALRRMLEDDFRLTIAGRTKASVEHLLIDKYVKNLGELYSRIVEV